MFHTFTTRLKRTPIFLRLVIGNAVIIILGAVIGTYLAHILTDYAATLWHFVLFASIGILVSLALNYVIVRLSLQPLRDLRQIVSRLQAGQADVQQLALTDTDPDIYHLTAALNSLVTQLEASNRQLHLLSERVITAQEEERKRIARSLHDDTGQSLSTLIINLERLEHRLAPQDAGLADRLRTIRGMASESLECLRSIIYDLRPAILDDLGLLPAIRWYARTNLESAGIKLELDFPDELAPLSPPLTTTLFRIVQEGVNNIIRHSHARHAAISMAVDGNEVNLRLQDDGQGFDPALLDQEAFERQHWGLVGIQERIELVGGRMSITSDPDHGTTLLVTAPVGKNEGAAGG